MSKECIHFLGPLCIYIYIYIYTHTHTHTQISNNIPSENMYAGLNTSREFDLLLSLLTFYSCYSSIRKMHSKPELYFLSFPRGMKCFDHQLFLRPLSLRLVSCMYFPDLEILCLTFLAYGETSYFLYLCRKLHDVVFPEPSRTFSNCLVEERCSGCQFLLHLSSHFTENTVYLYFKAQSH